MSSLLKKTDGDSTGKKATLELIGQLRNDKRQNLQPNDPSAGLILTQGHYIVHLVYWFMLTFIVEFRDEDSFTCLQQDESGNFVEIPGVHSHLNRACHFVKDLHLVCFILMVIAQNYVPKKMTTNVHIIRLFMGFVTVPVYIYMILWFESALEDDRVKFLEGTAPPTFNVKGRVCVAKFMGNVKHWAHIEITTFYINILVMMFYLLKERCNLGKPKKEDAPEDRAQSEAQ